MLSKQIESKIYEEMNSFKEYVSRGGKYFGDSFEIADIDIIVRLEKGLVNKITVWVWNDEVFTFEHESIDVLIELATSIIKWEVK